MKPLIQDDMKIGKVKNIMGKSSVCSESTTAAALQRQDMKM